MIDKINVIDWIDQLGDRLYGINKLLGNIKVKLIKGRCVVIYQYRVKQGGY